MAEECDCENTYATSCSYECDCVYWKGKGLCSWHPWVRAVCAETCEVCGKATGRE